MDDGHSIYRTIDRLRVLVGIQVHPMPATRLFCAGEAVLATELIGHRPSVTPSSGETRHPPTSAETEPAAGAAPRT
jgi:hypothetical protein